VKAKIFGVNAARLYDIEPITGSSGLTPEEVEAVRSSMAPARTYGPTTVRQSMGDDRRPHGRIRLLAAVRR
jgi:hypothetical protein